MGRSRRRAKKTVPKVKVGLIKRKKNQKSRVPVEVVECRQDIEETLQSRAGWNAEDTLKENYVANQLVVDPNEGFGRNNKVLPLKSKEEREARGEPTHSDDDELRAACNRERHIGKALPARPTPTQRSLMDRLVKKYSTDTEAMMKDRKLNPMQHSAGRLKMLLEAYTFWSEDDKHDFRAPVKPPKRIL